MYRTNIYIHDFPQRSSTNTLIYADDTKWRLTINPNKTELPLATKRSTDIRTHSRVMIKGTEIKKDNTIKYLWGCWSTRSVTTQHLGCKKMEALCSLYPIIASRHADLETKIIVYKTIIRAIMFHTVDIWLCMAKIRCNRLHSCTGSKINAYGSQRERTEVNRGPPQPPAHFPPGKISHSTRSTMLIYLT